jgi:hypothetical protein
MCCPVAMLCMCKLISPTVSVQLLDGSWGWRLLQGGQGNPVRLSEQCQPVYAVLQCTVADSPGEMVQGNILMSVVSPVNGNALLLKAIVSH